MAERRLQFCDACLQLDDHPKHVQTRLKARDGRPDGLTQLPEGAPVDAVAQLLNPQVVVRHMDCCAAAGCEDCAESEAANEGRRGAELIDHLHATREEVS